MLICICICVYMYIHLRSYLYICRYIAHHRPVAGGNGFERVLMGLYDEITADRLMNIGPNMVYLRNGCGGVWWWGGADCVSRVDNDSHMTPLAHRGTPPSKHHQKTYAFAVDKEFLASLRGFEKAVMLLVYENAFQRPASSATPEDLEQLEYVYTVHR